MWGGLPDYNHRAYKYEPKWEKMVERHPDKVPSFGAIDIKDDGADLVWSLDVRGLGVVKVRMSGGHPDGKFRPESATLLL